MRRPSAEWAYCLAKATAVSIDKMRRYAKRGTCSRARGAQPVVGDHTLLDTLPALKARRNSNMMSDVRLHRLAKAKASAA